MILWLGVRVLPLSGPYVSRVRDTFDKIFFAALLRLQFSFVAIDVHRRWSCISRELSQMYSLVVWARAAVIQSAFYPTRRVTVLHVVMVLHSKMAQSIIRSECSAWHACPTLASLDLNLNLSSHL